MWARRSELPGVELDLDAQERLLERLAPFAHELAATGFDFANDFYEHGDAEVAYAMVRHLRPARIVELGSGWSTRVLGLAAARNRDDGAPVRYVAYDPEPRDWTGAAGAPGLDALERLRGEDVPGGVFAELADGDVLFVDTTHVVRTGGDVNRVVLDVLPRLAPGVVVHFHDIWLPYEYHRELTRLMGMCWSEQYLLQAYLSGNAAYEVLLANQALQRERPAALAALCPGWDGTSGYPTAFWIRRNQNALGSATR